MASIFDISQAADLVDVAIQDVWLKGSEAETSLYKQYFNVETGISDYYLKDSSLSGLGYAGRIVENAAVTSATPVQGYDKTYTQVQFGLLLPITKMMWFFGIKKRSLTAITSEVRKACSDLRELRCAERLDNSFSTSYAANDVSGNYTVTITGGDGAAFISNAHTREDGGSNWNNRITDGTTVNMDFEYDALKAANRTAALVPNPLGKPTNVTLDTLIVSRGYAVDNRATEILGAINKGWIAGSADRDGSFAKASGSAPTYKIIRNPWISTNTLYWWMFDSSMKNTRYGFQYKESQGIELEGPNVVFKTGEIQYKATMMFDLGHNDPRGWTGSKNTNAT